MQLLKSEEMKAVEARAAAFGMSYQRMMENAGAAVARNIRVLAEQKELQGRTAVIVCGKGNNGGDGFVIARKLHESGWRVSVVLAGSLPASEQARTAFSQMANLALPTYRFDGDREKCLAAFEVADVIVDAVFGFSFYGEVREAQAALFAEMNNAKALTVAVDVPSGVHCDSGHCDKNAVRADVTVAISALKPAHILHPAAEHCGRIVIASIGIPEDCFREVKSTLYTCSAAEIGSFLPERPTTAHKGTFGHLLCVCGSRRMPGAAFMAAKAALRCGAGLVTAAFPRSMYHTMAFKLTETLLLPLAETEQGSLSRQSIPTLLHEIESDKYSAIVIGCGLFVCEDTAAVLKAVLEHARVPVVVDADGINILSSDIDILQNAACPVVLTPHPKEMARLCSMQTSDVQAQRAELAQQTAQTHGVYVVLKGANTVIASPHEDAVYVNATGNNGLSKGGSGDVLAGMLGALCAQGLSLPQALCAGVYLHGYAADVVAAELSRTGMLPTDVIEALAKVFAAFEH